MDATVKLLAHRFDALQLTFFRFVSGSLFAVAAVAVVPAPRCRARAAWPLHALRCALLLVALVATSTR
jgi:hypothetical protein